MIRNAAHRCPFLKAAGFSRQGKFQFLACFDRIVKEHLIKITETIEKNTILILFFGLQILLHHRSYI